MDSVSLLGNIENHDSDDDIQILAVTMKRDRFRAHTAGPAMAADLTECSNNLGFQNEDLVDSLSTFSEPGQVLIDCCVGGPPVHSNTNFIANHPNTQCSQINPIHYSSLSQRISSGYQYQHLQSDNTDHWYWNAQITGLGRCASSFCGQQN